MLDPLSLNIPTTTSRDRVPDGPPKKLLKPSPTHPDDYILEFDYSHFLSNFLLCAKRGENVSVFHREATRDVTALNFGKLFHRCEELRLLHGLTPEVIAKQREEISRHFVDYPVPVTEYRNASRMINVVDKYNSLYAHDGWPDKVYIHEGEKFVERPFKIEVCTIPVNGQVPYDRYTLLSSIPKDIADCGTEHTGIRNIHCILTGRIDAILSDSNVLWVVDHKTSSRGGQEFESAFTLSLQTRGYSYAATRLGIPVAGLIMNAAVVRPLTKTGTGTEFQRHFYPYSADSLSEFHDNLCATLSNFVHCLTRGFFPQTSLSFKSPCSWCDFADNCRLPRHQRAADLASSLYRDITWSPINED